MTHALITFVEFYGLLAVFILMAAESCGIPFPSEVIMPFAGAFAALGHLSLVGVIFAGALGNLVGSLVAYALAARFGEPLLLGPGRWVGLSRSHLDLARRWFDRHGLLAIFIGRLLPAVRTYISFPAGLSGIGLGSFIGLTFAGALPWCALLATAGYILGNNYERISGPIGKVAIVIALLVVVALVVWFIRGRRSSLRRDNTGWK